MTEIKDIQPVVDVDKAWHSLYKRLHEDQPQSSPAPEKSYFSMPLFRWVAAAAVILGIFTAVIQYLNPGHPTTMLSMSNNDPRNVLVKTLNDGSTVYLTANSSISYPEQFSGDAREVKMRGDVFFDIARNPKKPFKIETEKVCVRVLGTAFNIKNETKSGFELTVLRGKVEVTQKSDGASAYVVAGEGIKIVDSHWVRFRNSDASFSDSYSRNMRFKDEPLRNIVKVLNQYTSRKIILQGGDELQTRKLNVKFYNNDINRITNIISLALHLKREITPDSIYVLRP